MAQKAPPPQLLWAMVCIRPLQDTQFRSFLDSGHGGTGHPDGSLGRAGSAASRHRLRVARVLGEISPLTPSDLESLEQFLSALSSPTSMDDQLALPKSVPSGDSTFVRP